MLKKEFKVKYCFVGEPRIVTSQKSNFKLSFCSYLTNTAVGQLRSVGSNTTWGKGSSIAPARLECQMEKENLNQHKQHLGWWSFLSHGPQTIQKPVYQKGLILICMVLLVVSNAQ